MGSAGAFQEAEGLIAQPLINTAKTRASDHKKAYELYLQAKEAWGTLRYDDALTLCQESIKECETDIAKGRVYPDDNKALASTYGLLGRVKYKQRHYREALTALTKSIELNPANPATYSWRAKVYAQLGDNQHMMLDRVSQQQTDSHLDKQTKALSRILGEGFDEE